MPCDFCKLGTLHHNESNYLCSHNFTLNQSLCGTHASKASRINLELYSEGRVAVQFSFFNETIELLLYYYFAQKTLAHVPNVLIVR